MIRTVGKFFASILSIILFFVILVIMFLSTSKDLVTKENLSNYIEKADVLNIDINTLFNLKEESGLTLKEKITEIAHQIEIPEEIIKDILESKDLNDLLGEFFSQTIHYALNGGEKPQISEETTRKMINVANDSLEKHINVILSEEQLEKLIIDYSSSLTNLVPERQQMIGEFPIDIIRNILNFNVNYLYLIVVVIVILIGFLTMSIYKPIKYLAIPMLIAGIIFVIFGCMDNFISNILLDQAGSFNNFILPLIISVLTLWFKCGVLMSFSGLFLIIIYIVINRIIINGKNSKDLEKTRRYNIEDIKIK